MPRYGIGIYVFDSEQRLYLVKKPGSKFGLRGSNWLVPGETFDKPWHKHNKTQRDKLIANILTNESPITSNLLDDRRLSLDPLGSWSHKDDGVEYVFDNFVIKLSESFRVFTNGGRISNVNITGNPFDILELPVDSMYSLTQEFFKSSLFHYSGHIPTKTNEQERREFERLLSNDYKKYFLFKVLVPGGYGRVYVTLDIATLSPRVVKIPIANPRDKVWQERFLLEGKALLSLIHNKVKNIEELFSINRIENNRYYLLKEYIKGENLQKSSDKIKEHHIKEIIGTIVKTLSEVHKHGICHRDLKPNNIMFEVREDGSSKTTLIDFGLVKNLKLDIGEDQHLTKGTFNTGNALYQSVITYNNYKEHNLLDDYYSVLHIFYWLFNNKSFYEDCFSSSIRDYETLLLKVKDCKSKYQDPFMEENAVEEFCKKRNKHSCIEHFSKFHRIVSQAYSDIYRIRDGKLLLKEGMDATIMQTQLVMTADNILNIFG